MALFYVSYNQCDSNLCRFLVRDGTFFLIIEILFLTVSQYFSLKKIKNAPSGDERSRVHLCFVKNEG